MPIWNRIYSQLFTGASIIVAKDYKEHKHSSEVINALFNIHAVWYHMCGITGSLLGKRDWQQTLSGNIFIVVYMSYFVIAVAFPWLYTFTKLMKLYASCILLCKLYLNTAALEKYDTDSQHSPTVGHVCACLADLAISGLKRLMWPGSPPQLCLVA